MKKKFLIFTFAGLLILGIGTTLFVVHKATNFVKKYIQWYDESRHDLKYWDSYGLSGLFARTRVNHPSSIIKYKKGSVDKLYLNADLKKGKLRDKNRINVYLYVKKSGKPVSSETLTIPGYKILTYSCVWLPVEYRFVGSDLYLFRIWIEPEKPHATDRPDALTAYLSGNEIGLLKNPDIFIYKDTYARYSNYWERRAPNIVYSTSKLINITPPEKWFWKRWTVINGTKKRVAGCTFSSEPAYFNRSTFTEKSELFGAGWMPKDGKTPDPKIVIHFKDGSKKRVIKGLERQRFDDCELALNEFPPE